MAHLVGSPDRKFLGCFNDAELVGVVGVGREQSVKERHIAFIPLASAIAATDTPGWLAASMVIPPFSGAARSRRLSSHG